MLRSPVRERYLEAVPIGLVFREEHQHVLWGKEYCRLLEQDCGKGISSAGKASATADAFPRRHGFYHVLHEDTFALAQPHTHCESL